MQACLYIISHCGFSLHNTLDFEVHLQHLLMIEDLDTFNTLSIGGAILAHMYKKLLESTRPRWSNITRYL